MATMERSAVPAVGATCRRLPTLCAIVASSVITALNVIEIISLNIMLNIHEHLSGLRKFTSALNVPLNTGLRVNLHPTCVRNVVNQSLSRIPKIISGCVKIRSGEVLRCAMLRFRGVGQVEVPLRVVDLRIRNYALNGSR